MQALGEQLIGLSEEQLGNFELTESLFDAITAARQIRSHGAMRRQCQHIGKLMRQVDAEAIRRSLELLQRQEKVDKDLFRQAELWRDRIVQDRYQALKGFFDMMNRESEELTTALVEYSGATADVTRRALRRKIFRFVHAELTSRYRTMPSDDTIGG